MNVPPPPELTTEELRFRELAAFADELVKTIPEHCPVNAWIDRHVWFFNKYDHQFVYKCMDAALMW